MTNRLWMTVLLTVLTAGAFSAARADEIAKQASKVMKEHGKAVVQVEAVLTISAEGALAQRIGDQEQKLQATGTVIAPDGLTVVSYVAINPTSALKNVRLPGGRGRVSLKGELSDVKICLPDGTEIPARVVLKDEDLDLAFIMPKDKLDKQAAKEIQVVDLTKAAAKAHRLDQVVRLGRLPKEMNRELAVEIDRINAVITKPRLVYVLGGAQPGTPVFATSGKLLGIITFHKKAGGGSISGGKIGGVPVVLPTAEVKKIADQARQEVDKDKAADKKEAKDSDN